MVLTDDVTGLPTFSTDQYIEQIPLGQQVFPFQDLDAGARPRRQPLYGDDVLPTSALIVGQDPNGQPRAATMDTERNMWTRDVQLQSFGQALDDGAQGPIDVNVVGAGSGNITAGGAAYNSTYDEFSTLTRNDTLSSQLYTFNQQGGTLYGLNIDIAVIALSTVLTANYSVPFYLQSKSVEDFQMVLFDISLLYPSELVAGFSYPGYFQKRVWFTPPLNMATTFPGENDVTLFCDNKRTVMRIGIVALSSFQEL